MKKITSLFLTLLMLLCVSGCGTVESEQAANAVLNAALDAAIDAVENYETSTTPEDPDQLLDEMLGQPETPLDPNQALNEFISNAMQSKPADSDEIGVIGSADGPTSILVSSSVPDVDGYYYDLENVVLYLDFYGDLPENYITKDEARALGWKGGTPERYLEGSAIGGDRFGNREGLLPKGEYTECDLNTLGQDERGAQRLVFSDDGEYYYTEDHYASFTQVWVEDGEVIYE